jgi:NTE family protein
MGKTKIAIACQGGGSQTAFTAGVLISLLTGKAYEENNIVSLSGASGGAVCAALAWSGLLKQAKGAMASAAQSLESFWKDNRTENVLEHFLNESLIDYVQLVDKGVLPEWKTSPYSPWRQAWVATLQLFLPQFYDFKGLLKKHIDFEKLYDMVDPVESPVLVIGAADVRTGEFVKFNSRDGNIDIDALLASAAVPSLSKAVEIGAGAYWDGQFSDNPPTDELIDDDIVGKERIPDQLWVIQINPTQRDRIPQTPEEIVDRRNELIGNASLFQDLQHICRVNKWITHGAFNADYVRDHNLKAVDIFIIQMPADLQKRLNYASKLNRDEKFIRDLIAHGEQMGRQFLKHPESMRFKPTYACA